MVSDVIYDNTEGSVEGTELMIQLHKQFVDKYIDRIEQLDNIKEFVRDDSYHNVHSTQHH